MWAPSNTITCLFSDIEGSTRLWEEHPALMQVALARHDEIVRHAVEAHHGRIFKAGGDGFCVSFASATDAVAAALEAQRALLCLAQDTEAPIRVRMALHTGDAEERDGDCFGPSLNRCARVLSSAHGGQVLMTATTAAIASVGLPEPATLRDVGEHRLRDLVGPERLYQLVHPELPVDFPPLRSLEAFLNNLPAQTTRLIGREEDLRQVCAQLSATRLLTLTGTGGAGKTRLALQAASDALEQWPDGVWFVDLALLADPPLVDHALLAALGKHPEPGRPARDTLLDWLRERRLLLLLDNCEHLVGAAAELAEAVLTSCPHVALLATSREALRAAGETVWRVPSLSFPDMGGEPPPPQGLAQYAAVQLFVERATAVRPDFSVTNENAPAVAQICWRLDGMPLAIELAAARLRVLSPEQIEKHLDDCFHLLTGGRRTAPTRHQTLRAALEWSHNLLTEKERAIFRRLSVFAGWLSLEAAEAVGAAGDVESADVLDLLTELCDKSLVLADGGDHEARYRLLATLRAYARERLTEAGEEETTGERHAQYYLALAENKVESEDNRRLAELRRAAKHYTDLVAALEWFTQAASGFEPGLRLAQALKDYWNAAGLLGEGRTHLSRLLDHPGAREGTALRADAFHVAGELASEQGDPASARPLYEESARIRRELGDEEGALRALVWVGFSAHALGDRSGDRQIREHILARERELGDPSGIAWALSHLALGVHNEGDDTRATDLLEQSLAIYESLGDSDQASFTRRALAEVRGDLETIERFHRERLAVARQRRDEGAIAYELGALRYFAYRRRDYAVGRAYAEEELEIARRSGDTGRASSALYEIGRAALELGDHGRARRAFEEALRIERVRGHAFTVPNLLGGLTDVALAQGDYEAAKSFSEERLVIWQGLGVERGVADAHLTLGHAAWGRCDYAEAKVRFEQGLALFRKLGLGVTGCLRHLGYVAWAQGVYAEAQRLAEESLASSDGAGNQEERACGLSLLGLVASDQGDQTQARRLLQEALDLQRGQYGQGELADSLSRLGIVAWREGSYREARELQLECLRTRSQRGDIRGICLSFERLAAVSNSEGDAPRAARLFGAADSIRQQMGAPDHADAYAEYAGVLAAVRSALGDEAFDLARAEGRAMTVEVAVAYALGKGAPG